MVNPVVQKVADFYARTFGWNVTHHPEGRMMGLWKAKQR